MSAAEKSIRSPELAICRPARKTSIFLATTHPRTPELSGDYRGRGPRAARARYCPGRRLKGGAGRIDANFGLARFLSAKDQPLNLGGRLSGRKGRKRRF